MQQTHRPGAGFDAEAVTAGVERGRSVEGAAVASDRAVIESVAVVDPLTLTPLRSRLVHPVWYDPTTPSAHTEQVSGVQTRRSGKPERTYLGLEKA